MIKSLQQRFFIFLLLPAALLLVAMGFFGFIYARGIMLDQWREAAVLKLQRAAHHIDMHLNQPITRIKMLQKTPNSQHGFKIQTWVIERLKELDGVTSVDLQWAEEESAAVPLPGRGPGKNSIRFHHTRFTEVMPPVYDAKTGAKTVSLISNLEDENNKSVGILRVTLLFEYLLQDIENLGWWQSDTVYLIDASGKILTQTKSSTQKRARLGETEDFLESVILDELKSKPHGTILGPGVPPEQVAGFYKMTQAPWAIVMVAPGDKILAPIIGFRLYYALAVTFFIIMIILVIRIVGGKIVGPISDLSEAAQKISRGNYGEPLQISSQDEIGRLILSFNTMVQGLKERDFIRNTFGRYMDQKIAKELMRHPEAARLGGEKREVAVLMSDLRGFTPLAESLNPDVTIRLLNRYFSKMIEIIGRHQGIIVDFLGDAILVFFDPLEGPVQPVIERSIRCALEMANKMEDLNKENRKEELPELKMGIGVNAGEVVVGNIGSETRAKYGIVGSAVNITQRIQSLAGEGEVIVSDSVYQNFTHHLILSKSFKTSLKGIQEPVTLHLVKAFQKA